MTAKSFSLYRMGWGVFMSVVYIAPQYKLKVEMHAWHATVIHLPAELKEEGRHK